MPLTVKQEGFAQAVASGKSGSEAYRMHYKVDKLTAEAVHTEASRLRAHPMVSRRIKELAGATLEAAQQTIGVDLPRTMFENARLAFSDIRRLLTPEGDMRPPSEWDDDTAAAVASYKVKTTTRRDDNGEEIEDRTVEVRLWDKGAPIDRFMRHFGAFEKDNAQKSAGILEGLPRDSARAILDHLRRLTDGSVVAEQSAADEPRRADSGA